MKPNLTFTGQFKDEAAAALRAANLPVTAAPIIGIVGIDLAYDISHGYDATREDLASVGYGLTESRAMPGIYWVRPL